MLDIAYAHLQQQAAKISDLTAQRSFLENIPWNREINDLWRAARKV